MYANRGSSDLTLAEPRYCSPSKALFCNCLSPEIFYSAAARLQSLVQRGSREQGLASMYPKWLQRLACTQLFNCIIFIFIFLKGNPYTWVEVWCDTLAPSQTAAQQPCPRMQTTLQEEMDPHVCLLLLSLGESPGA